MKTKILLTILMFVINTLLCFSQTNQEKQQQANEKFNKGKELMQKGLFDDAITYFQASGLLYKDLGEIENYLTNEYYSAVILTNKGELNTALLAFNNILKIAESNKLGESKLICSSLDKIGEINFHMAKYNESLRNWEDSKDLKIKLFGEMHLEVAKSYSNLGNYYNITSDYSNAMNYYVQARKIYAVSPSYNKADLAVLLNNMGIIATRQGNNELALTYTKESLQINLDVFGENHVNVANSLYGLGDICFQNGEYDLALEYMNKCLAIKREKLGENHFKLAEVYNYLSNIYLKKDQYELALQYYTMALDNQQKNLPENHPDIAVSYNNIGNIYKEMDRNKEAREYYENALKLKQETFGNFGVDIADLFLNIGTSYFAEKNYDKAIESYSMAIDTYEGIFGEQHPSLASPYLNIANVYFEKSVDTNIDSLSSRYLISSLKFYQKSFSANVKGFDYKLVTLYDNPSLDNYYDQNRLLLTFKDKAKAFNKKYSVGKSDLDLNQSYTIYLLCDTLIDRIRKSITKKEDKIMLAIQTTEIYGDAIEICLELYSKNFEMEYFDKAFYFSEKNKAGTLLDAIAGSHAQKFAGIPDSLIRYEKELNQQIAYYEKQIADIPTEEREVFYRNQLFKTNEKYRKLIKQFEKDYPKFFEMKYSNNTTKVKDIQQILDSVTAIRSYFIAETKVFIFTICKDKFFATERQKSSTLDYDIYNFYNQLLSKKSKTTSSFVEAANKLNYILFSDTIPENIKTLIIVPDGALGMIPFDAILTEKVTNNALKYSELPYVVKKYNICYTYSANLFNLMQKQTRSSFNEKIWCGIAPVFDKENEVYFNEALVPAIPGSEIEVNTIKDKFLLNNQSCEVHLHLEANENKFKKGLFKNTKILHIATHGFVNSEKPELSGLILSRDVKTDDDGVLYTGELFNLEINSDLVVLSACETGLGKITKGEGVIGLSRAVLYAGTKNLIVSLWAVSDKSTTNLMIDFYQDMIENAVDFSIKTDYAGFLRKAKLKMIDSESVYSHPYFWSPFILIGK